MSHSSESELAPFEYGKSFHLTQQPDPNFKPGNGGAGSKFLEDWRRKGEEAGYETIDPKTTQPRDMYRLLIGGITPRPIAFVSSTAQDGTHNLAPFSYFNVINHNPPLIIVSFSNPGPGKEKDTLANIKFRKTFTVNIISEPFAEGANFTSIDAPASVSEWHGSGLTMEKSTVVEPPRVKESAFSMECELWKDIDLVPSEPADAPATGVLIIGLIKLLHVRKDVLVQPDSTEVEQQGARPFSIDSAKLRPIARMGGITYTRVTEGFELQRPVWKDVKDTYSAEEK